MAFYRLKTVQNIPTDIDTIWDFFISHTNLKKITPSHMGFDITSDHPEGEKVYPGMIITYCIRPLLGIPINWITEITQLKEKEYFVDEQRFGPYAMWHHQHWFREIEGGVQMTDIVDYKPPFGFFGDWMHTLFIEGKLNEIFEYRFNKIEEVFGKFPPLKQD